MEGIMWWFVVLFHVVLSNCQATNLFASSDDVVINLVEGDFEFPSPSHVKIRLQELTFVNFHSSSCGHCISHAPTWVEFARALRLSGASAAALDCDEFRDICSSLKVSTAPSIKVFKDRELVRENIGERLHELFQVAIKEFGLALVISGSKASEAERIMKEHVDSSVIQKESMT